MADRKWYEVKSNWAAIFGTAAAVLAVIPGCQVAAGVVGAVAGGLGWIGIASKAERFVQASEQVERAVVK